MPRADIPLVFLRLKGCAKRIGRALCGVGADRDLRCCAIGVTVMVIAVLDVALDALDVIAAMVCSLVFHFDVPFK